MERIEGLEVWRHKPSGEVHLLVVSRAESGVWTAWRQQYDDDGTDEKGRTYGATVEVLVSQQVEYADLATFTRRDIEFRTRAGVVKWAHRHMALVLRATKDGGSWEPGDGWERLYEGALVIEQWNKTAKRDKALRKIAQIKEEIDALSKRDVKSMSDAEYSDYRRRKIQLKRQHAKLQGGDNA